jgi:hypothetical protein
MWPSVIGGTGWVL